MASHREEELRGAARVLGQAARASGFEPRLRSAQLDDAAEETTPPTADPARAEVFDFDAPEAWAA
jgi:hypothetical protein